MDKKNVRRELTHALKQLWAVYEQIMSGRWAGGTTQVHLIYSFWANSAEKQKTRRDVKRANRLDKKTRNRTTFMSNRQQKTLKHTSKKHSRRRFCEKKFMSDCGSGTNIYERPDGFFFLWAAAVRSIPAQFSGLATIDRSHYRIHVSNTRL